MQYKEKIEKENVDYSTRISNVHLMLRIIRQPHINQTLLINHKKSTSTIRKSQAPPLHKQYQHTAVC